jgi:hypothetical protein
MIQNKFAGMEATDDQLRIASLRAFQHEIKIWREMKIVNDDFVNRHTELSEAVIQGIKQSDFIPEPIKLFESVDSQETKVNKLLKTKW